MSVLIHQCSNHIELTELEPQIISRDWYGASPEFGLCYCAAKQEEQLHLLFTANITPDLDWNHGSGDFVEGLWKEDVAELFICDDNTSAYQEFNFSPSGAWWTQMFSDYRTEAPDLLRQRPELTIKSVIDSTGWQLLVELPLDQLSVCCRLTEQSRINICAIFNQNPRSYFSVNDLQAEDPDFHLNHNVLPVRIVAV